MAPSPVPRAGLGELFGWLFRTRRRLRVVGVSFLPTIAPGTTVFMKRTSEVPPKGTVVVVEHPEKPGLEIVKRLAHTTKDGSLYVVSDNKKADNAQDSRTFGPVPVENLIGIVTSQVS